MTHPELSEICCVILAAGESRRFGKRNKLLAEIEGIPMLERVLRAVTRSKIGKIIVVTGADHESIVALLSRYDVEWIRNENWQDGMGSSLAKGVAAIDANSCAGILICLGDLPYLKVETINRVIDAFELSEGKTIVVPNYEGKSGHPLIFPVSFHSEIKQLTGDRGAKGIIKRMEPFVRYLNIESDEIIRDIDRPGDVES